MGNNAITANRLKSSSKESLIMPFSKQMIVFLPSQTPNLSRKIENEKSGDGYYHEGEGRSRA